MLLPLRKWITSPESSRGTTSTPSSASVSRGVMLDIVETSLAIGCPTSPGGVEDWSESMERGEGMSRNTGPGVEVRDERLPGGPVQE